MPQSDFRPGQIEQVLEEAILAFRMQRPDKAERLAGSILQAYPTHGPAAWVLGQVLLAQGRAADAVEPLRRAARDSVDPALETLLGRALAEARQGEAALERLRLAIQRRPAYELAFLELGEQLSRLARADEAAEAFEAGLALFPGSAVLRMGLGYLHLNRNQRSKARALFSAVRAADPARRDAMLALARVLVLDGEHGEAANLYRQALELIPDDPMTRVELGRCLLELGEQASGEAALKQASRSANAVAGLAVTTLASARWGRLFLRPSAAERFLLADDA